MEVNIPLSTSTLSLQLELPLSASTLNLQLYHAFVVCPLSFVREPNYGDRPLLFVFVKFVIRGQSRASGHIWR